MRCQLLGLLLVLTPALLLAQSAPRSAPPSAAALEQAKRLVAEAYAKDYQAAKAPAQKHALAQKMLDDAAQPTSDRAGLFALLDTARKISVGIGDIEQAMTAVEATSSAFQVDAAQMKQDVLRSVAPLVKTPADHAALTRYIGRELPKIVALDRYESATDLMTLALASAKKANDADLVKQWTRRQTKLAALAEAYAPAQAALATLETAPIDAAANTLAGKYTCFAKEDWANGLTMLALGDDPVLQPLAARALRDDLSATEQLQLADDWFDYAQDKSPLVKEAIWRHVGMTYQRQLAGLPTLAKRRVGGRLAEIAAATSPLVKDEWVEILDYVDLERHMVENLWERKGLAIIAPQPDQCKAFKIPVIVDGSYELRVKAVRTSGTDTMRITLSNTANDVEFWLNSGARNISGLHRIDGQDLRNNPSRTKPYPLFVGRPFVLALAVDRRDDAIAIGATVDGQRYFQWQGDARTLDSSNEQRRQGIYVATCTSTLAVFSVQFKLKSGHAWVTE